MKLQKLVALSLVAALGGCAAVTPLPPSPEHSGGNLQLATLRRAAKYPWMDGGRCAVEASPNGWEIVARRCYRELDLARIKFTNPAHQSPKNACSSRGLSKSGDARSSSLVVQRALLFDLGTAGAASELLSGADVPEAAGICMLLLPEAAGVVILVGVAVIVGVVIVEAIAELEKKCPPCPPPPPPETDYDHEHFDKESQQYCVPHWHYYQYDQDRDCVCHGPRRLFGGCGVAP